MSEDVDVDFNKGKIEENNEKIEPKSVIYSVNDLIAL